MPVEAQVKPVSLSKPRLLEYLERLNVPVTAKVASIDLDTRQSTACELLERCVAQGLVERTSNERPREYRITDAGRQRSEFFPSGQPQSPCNPDDPPESNPGREEESGRAEPLNVTELRAEVLEQLGGLREDVRDLFEVLDLRPVRGEGLQERAERVKQRLEKLAGEAESEAREEAARNLYRARYEFDGLGFFRGDAKEKVRARIADLEAEVGKETAEQVKRVVALEQRIFDESGDAGTLRAVFELRESLHFPASLFGRGPEGAKPEEGQE